MKAAAHGAAAPNPCEGECGFQLVFAALTVDGGEGG